MGSSGFAAGLAAGAAVGNQLARSFQEGQLRRGLEKAAEVNPETIETTKLSETTPNTEGMVYDSDTGQYLPKYMDGAQPTEQALAQQNGEGETPAGVTPTFDSKTTSRYRMGSREQSTPFSQEQIDAQRFRNQADVYSKNGMAEKASALQGLAKTREEEATNVAIREGGTAGLKNSKDMRDDEKMFAASKGMYERALSLGRPDLASGYYNQMMQNRDTLLSRANERADRMFRATGNIGGFIDAYNKYVADGDSVDAYKQNQDGSYTFTVSSDGKTREAVVPKEQLGEYLLAIRDPKRVSEIEAERAKILFKARVDAQEKLNTPVAVGKDQTLVVPGTGQTFAPSTGKDVSVKDAGPVLDDARRMLLERSGNFDQTTGKWNWSQEAVTKAGVAERLYVKNPTLTPAMLAEIADKGTVGMATIEVGGEQKRVPAVTHNGRTFLLGGADAGIPTPADPPAATKPVPNGVGTRAVSGKITPAPGLAPVAPSAGFPKVSAADQMGRDAEAGRLRVAEAGGSDQARRDLAELDAALKNPRLDGTQRRILQTERNLLAAGLSAAS